MFLALFGWGLAASCASGGDTDELSPGGGTGGSDDASISLDAPADGDAGGAGGIPDGSICTGVALHAEPFPLDIFVMLDQSGSMSMDAGNLLTRWQTVKNAITQFVQQDEVAGI